VKRRRRTSNPRVRIHKTGTVTLSGFNWDDLRSLLTSASLSHYASIEEAEKWPEGDRRAEAIAWHKEQHAFIHMAEASLTEAIAATHTRRPPTKADRLAAVREEIRFRKLLDRLIEEACAKRKAETEGQ